MKAMPFAKFKLTALVLLLSIGWMPSFAWSQAVSKDVSSASTQLSKIEKKLAESELREKQILENQAKILDELQKLRVLVRRS